MAFLALLCIPTAAQADDVSAAARSVVRVVIVVSDGGEVTDFGHGSGFAVARNRVVTNAHVVEASVENPGGVTIGIVPSQGKRSYDARIVAIDFERDLALLELVEGALPPATLYGGAPDEGSQVVALGYPGNVDMVTAKTAADFIVPQQPTRSVGHYSNARSVRGVSALIHTASIAHGNSGGPLMDQCGRVLGVNSMITDNQDGDSTFGFAIAGSELAAFLNKARQPVSRTRGDCVSIQDALRSESERSAKEREQAALAVREAAANAHRDALARAQSKVEDAREDRLAIALVLGILGVAGLSAGGLMLAKDRGSRAAVFGAGGALLVLAGAATFLTRPSADDIVIGQPEPAKKVVVETTGPLVCRFQAERSRVTVSDTDDVPIEWGKGGCMNGRTQYARTGSVWTRILVPNDEDTVHALQYDPVAREYVVTRYLLSEQQMSEARALRPQLIVKTCSADPAQAERLDDLQSKIRSVMPKLPNERLVFKCEPR